MNDSRFDSRIEPGLLPVFRWFLGIRLALLALTLCSRSAARFQRFPGLGMLETGLLLIYLSWSWPRRHLGRLYLPIALAIVSIGPEIERALTVARRLRGGATGLAVTSHSWQLIAILFVPLVLMAWQYGFRWVLILCAGTSILDVVVSVPLAIAGGPRMLSVLGILFVRNVLYLLVGYLVARLVAAQRAQRDKLAQANAQLALYATTVERLSVSHERNRMARELHDTLAHTLSAVSVQLEAANALWDSDRAAARDTLNRAQKLTRDGLQEVRRSLQALRAKPLEDLGLALAVLRLAEQGADRAGLSLKTDIDPNLDGLRPEVEQSLYRVAEEAVTNVVRHANARSLEVALKRANGCVRLDVIDDGAGFDPGGRRPDGHYGLAGMQERAALCGGMLDVTSRAGRGTTVRLTVEESPLPPGPTKR
jgi:signal transduction histidine kinase